MTSAQKTSAQKTSPQKPLEDLLAVLRQCDVSLWIDEGDRLRYRAAKDALKPELLAQLKERKAEILEFLYQAKLQVQPSSQLQIVPIERIGKLSVSFNQQRLWLVEQFDPGKPVYNLPLAYRFEGNLNVDALHRCLQEIVQRHEVLRSTFHMDDNEPYQAIAPKLEVSLPIVDLQYLPEDQREESAKQVASEEARKSFSLEQGPLFRFKLLSLRPKDHVLIYNTHHIISDGWSSEVFFKELTTLYAAFSANGSSPLSELSVQYVDYAYWQRRWLGGEVLQTQLNYWKQVLDGDLPVLQLPTDHPRPAISSYRGEIGRQMLPEPLTDALKEISQQGSTTLSMTLMTAFKVLLYRYSGQEDIIVGSPIAGRNRLETEGLIGFFVNTLAFRTNLSGNPNFREVLERVRQVSLGAYANQDIPFDQLVREVKPDRDPSRSPIFQAMFAMNAPWTQGASRELPDMTITSTFGYVHNSSSSFDLTLVMRDTGKGLRVSIEYSLDLFEPSTIERMISHFQTLLEGIVANPDQSISTLPLLPEAEQHQLLNAWNQTQVNYPYACLHQLIEAQVEKTPDEIAVLVGEHQLTYRDLNERANQLAYFLQRYGVSADVPVALYVERSLEFTIGILGTLKAGGAYIPIDPVIPSERRLDILRDAKPPVILTQSHLISSLPVDYEAKVISLDSDWAQIAEQPTQNLPCQTVPESLAYIIYTSGSTGKPKGVGIIHRGVVNHSLASAKLFDLTTQDRVLQFSNISFDICIEEVFPTWLTGATLVLRSEAIASSITEFLQFIAHYRITIADLPTAFWHELVNGLSTLQQTLPKSLRLIIVGGEKASYSTYKTWVALVGNYPRWLNTYGPTETTVTATVYDPSTHPKLLDTCTELPIGRPLANVQTYILDSNLQPVPIGVPGELLIGGAGLARGYLNSPELTSEKFISHSFHLNRKNPSVIQARLCRTGDRARYLPDGNIEFLGRLDDQIKIRGFRIELGEIEFILALHPAVIQSVVTVQTSASGQKQVIAYIVTDPQQPFDVVAIRNFIKDKLPAYMIPASFVELKVLPLTANGKVNYRALPEPDFNVAVTAELAIARDDLEKDLVAIWQEVLEIQPISIQDNFFDLGGHSLLAIRLFTLIEKKFSQNLPLATLLQAPTIQQLANVLRQEQKPESWSPLVAIKPDGSRPPLFCIHGGGFNVLVYRDLALGLNPDQPVYGLQAQGLSGRGGILANTLEDIAADYINEIRTVQPYGPYYLAGLSNGGNIALEMAQQLHAQGEQINLLAMFDCYGPGGIKLLPPFPRFLSSLRYALHYSVPRWFTGVQQSELGAILTKLQEGMKLWGAAIDSFRYKSIEQPMSRQENRQVRSHLNPFLVQKNPITQGMNYVSRYILQHSPWSFFNPSDQLGSSDDKIAKTLKDLEKSYKEIHKAYIPQPYAEKISIFCAEECPPGYRIAPHLGWDKVAKGRVETYKIPGHHISIMKSPILAEKMEFCLEKALNESCSP